MKPPGDLVTEANDGINNCIGQGKLAAHVLHLAYNSLINLSLSCRVAHKAKVKYCRWKKRLMPETEEFAKRLLKALIDRG